MFYQNIHFLVLGQNLDLNLTLPHIPSELVCICKNGLFNISRTLGLKVLLVNGHQECGQQPGHQEEQDAGAGRIGSTWCRQEAINHDLRLLVCKVLL